MAKTIENTDKFVAALNEKMGDENRSFTASAGRRFDKVIVTSYQNVSVYAFIERGTNDLYKAAGWAAPAKGIRYNGSELLNMAIEDADPYGSFLYAN